MKGAPLQKNRGIISTVLIVVIGLTLIGLLGFSVREAVSNETVQDNLSYAWEKATYVWDNYLERPARATIDFLKSTLWEASTEAINNLEEGESVTPEEEVPEPPR